MLHIGQRKGSLGTTGRVSGAKRDRLHGRMVVHAARGRRGVDSRVAATEISAQLAQNAQGVEGGE